MAKETNDYDDIAKKIDLMKSDYPCLRDKQDSYVFSALFIKVAFYKDPELSLSENDFKQKIHDGKNDLGIDILLRDPNPEGNGIIVGQAKFCKDISSEKVFEALDKMADGYKDLENEHYERANDSLVKSFIELSDMMDEESKIRFVFYTSAPKNRINIKRITEKFLKKHFIDTDTIEVSILFAADVQNEIEEAARWKSIVENDKICIDKAGNCLRYGDDAVIVNVSARSIKDLYTEHRTNLLALNLRYYIRNTELDKKIRKTIKDNPASFWFKNNGITIICENFRPDGREVHLENFSIINGGQTTYLLSRSECTAANDFYLMCKIIKIAGDLNGEFSLEIAEAANSQKPIKPSDLRVNASEQRTFAQAMKDVGVHYQTKRGKEVPPKFRTTYLHTKMEEVGKLCLAAIFQEPCKSRNNPSLSYKEDKYYTTIFKGNQAQVAQICKELLYMDYYFDKIFQPKFETANKNLPNAAVKIPFANHARRICVAFATLAARYHHGNITDKDVTALTSSPNSDEVYDMLRNLGDIKTLLPLKISTDAYDAVLDKLFKAIIKAGTQTYDYVCKYDENLTALTARNFLQNDKNYYRILTDHWDTLRDCINETFSET